MENDRREKLEFFLTFKANNKNSSRLMKPGPKIIIASCFVLLLFLAIVCGTLLYYYHKPSSFKSLIEKSISHATGTSLTIQEIFYSFNPLRVEARGIQIKPGNDLKGFCLEISNVFSDMVLEGSFGKKSLTLRNLKFDGFSFHATQELRLPEIDHTQKPSSFISQSIKRLVSFFLFREIKFQSAEINNGKVEAKIKDQIFLITNIQGALTPENLVKFSCSTMVQWLSKNTCLGAPEVHLVTNASISLAHPEVTCRVLAKEATFTSPSGNAKGIELEASLLYTHGLFEIEDVSVRIPKANLDLGGKKIHINDIQMHLQEGEIDMEKSGLILKGIRMDSAILKNLFLFVRLDKEQFMVELRGKQTDFIKSAVRLNAMPPGWRAKAIDTIEVRVIKKPKGNLFVLSSCELKELSFQDRDASIMGEDIHMHARIDSEIDTHNDAVTAKTEIQVDKGEVLYDRFYLNLGENGFIAKGNMRYNGAKALFQVPEVVFSLKDVLALKMDGSLLHKDGNKQFHCSMNLPNTDLRPIFKHLVFEPFKMEIPSLKTLNLAGNTSGELELTGNGEEFMAIGSWQCRSGKLSEKDTGLSLEGINIDFPIRYHTEKMMSNGDSLKGRIRINSMVLPLFLNQSLDVILKADNGKLSVEAPTVFKIPGGDIKVGAITATHIFRSDASIETSLTLENLDINPLLSRIWSRPVKGAINGKLEPLLLERATLKSAGDIEAGLFDGKVILSNLRATGIFTATPVIKFDATIKDLNLEELTTGTPFGKIKGVLNGYIKDIELADGQPQRFNLLLETTEKKGVSQKVSLKAIDNIARIGGTQSPFMGMAGRFASIFEEFRYKKIGIRASLENDIFRINGTIKEGEIEYIMKRGGFSGVNIVNHNPDNQISFKDMIKRIKRIYETQGKKAVH